jgi:hypothetical protein
VRERRVDVLDALLALRQAGALDWEGERPSWDHLFVSLKRLLGSAGGWEPPCPPELAFRLLQHRDAVAAALADLAWMGARRPGALRAAMTLAGANGTFELRLFAGGLHRPRLTAGGVAIGLEPAPEGGVRLAIAWGEGWGPAGRAIGPGRGSRRWPGVGDHWTLASA